MVKLFSLLFSIFFVTLFAIGNLAYAQETDDDVTTRQRVQCILGTCSTYQPAGSPKPWNWVTRGFSCGGLPIVCYRDQVGGPSAKCSEKNGLAVCDQTN